MTGDIEEAASDTAAGQRGPSIDLDFPASWPPALRDLAQQAVGWRGCTTRYTGDIHPPAHVDSAIDALLGRHGIIAYHCTRLLDAETDDIRVNGPRPASDDLIDAKLGHAVAAGHLTVEQRRSPKSGCAPRTTGSGAATAISNSFSHLYQPWLSRFLRSYQRIWSSNWVQVGSFAAGTGTAAIGRVNPDLSSSRASRIPSIVVAELHTRIR